MNKYVKIVFLHIMLIFQSSSPVLTSCNSWTSNFNIPSTSLTISDTPTILLLLLGISATAYTMYNSLLNHNQNIADAQLLHSTEQNTDKLSDNIDQPSLDEWLAKEQNPTPRPARILFYDGETITYLGHEYTNCTYVNLEQTIMLDTTHLKTPITLPFIKLKNHHHDYSIYFGTPDPHCFDTQTPAHTYSLEKQDQKTIFKTHIKPTLNQTADSTTFDVKSFLDEEFKNSKT